MVLEFQIWRGHRHVCVKQKVESHGFWVPNPLDIMVHTPMYQPSSSRFGMVAGIARASCFRGQQERELRSSQPIGSRGPEGKTPCILGAHNPCYNPNLEFAACRHEVAYEALVAHPFP